MAVRDGPAQGPGRRGPPGAGLGRWRRLARGAPAKGRSDGGGPQPGLGAGPQETGAPGRPVEFPGLLRRFRRLRAPPKAPAAGARRGAGRVPEPVPALPRVPLGRPGGGAGRARRSRTCARLELSHMERYLRRLRARDASAGRGPGGRELPGSHGGHGRDHLRRPAAASPQRVAGLRPPRRHRPALPTYDAAPAAATAPPAEAPATRADCLLEDLLSQELDTISSPGDAVGKLAGDVDDLENDRFFQMLLEAP